MKIFKNYTYSVTQIAIFKLALLFLGIAIGANWPVIFAPYTILLVIIGLLFGFYIAYISFRVDGE
ncbi:MAG: hypothetical protein WEA36_10720 [Balneolaceae bacterium]